MDSRQEAKLNMYKTVQDVCAENTATTSAHVPFTNSLAAFNAKVTEVINAAEETEEVITGVAADKTQLKLKLSQNAFNMSSTIFAYASSTGNQTLKHQTNYALSDFTRLPDNELPLVCTNIKDAATAHSADLVSWGITAGMVTALNTDITNYSGSIPKPRTAITNRTVENQNAAQRIREADIILKEQLDKLIVNFKTANPTFVDQYKQARKIIGPGSSPQLPQTPIAPPPNPLP